MVGGVELRSRGLVCGCRGGGQSWTESVGGDDARRASAGGLSGCRRDGGLAPHGCSSGSTVAGLDVSGLGSHAAWQPG